MLRRRAEFARADDVQWPMGDFRDGFGRQRLAASRVAAQKPDESLALARDDVVKDGGLSAVLRDEAADELLVLATENKLLENLIGPDDVLDAIKSEAA